MTSRQQTTVKEQSKRWGKTWATTGLVAGSLLLGGVGTITAQADDGAPANGTSDAAQTTQTPTQPANEIPLKGNVADDEAPQTPAGGSTGTSEQPADPDSTENPANSVTEKDAPEKGTGDGTTTKEAADADAPAAPATGDTTGATADKLAAKPTADALPADATVPDTPKTADQTIDDWMPDKNLQQFVLWGLQQSKVDVTDVSQITPEMMAQLKTLNADLDLEASDEAYFKMVSSITNLKGLDKATSLGSLVITPFANANKKWTGDENTSGAVTDVSALADLTNITNLQLTRNNISDITPLGKTFQAMNDSGGFAIVDFTRNHIYDVRALMVQNKAQFFMPSVGIQTIILPEVTLNPGTTHYVTSSSFYSNVNLNGDPHTDNKMISAVTAGQGSTGTAETLGYSRYLSWSNLQGPTGQLIYQMEQRGGDNDNPDSEPFNWTATVIQPYKLVANTGNMVVNYKFIGGADNGGVTLAPDTTLAGTTDDGYDVLQTGSVTDTIAYLKSKGFSYIRTSGDQSVTGQYGADADRIILLFGYQQVIHLVDEDGQTIGTDLKLSSNNENAYTDWSTAIPTVDGYTYDRVVGGTPTTDSTTGQLVLSGKLADQNPDIFIYYQAAQAKRVVNYLDESGKVIQAPGELTGAVGTDQTLDLPTIEDYVLVSTSDGTLNGQQLHVTMSKSTDPINITYKLAEYSHVVNFIDADSHEIATAVTVNGVKGSTQTINLPKVDGYVVDQASAGTMTDGKLAIKITNDANPINVFYKLAEYSHVVNFIDADSHEIATAITVNGVKGSTQTIELPKVDGYVVDQASSGTIANNQLSLIIADSKDPINVYFKKVIEQGLVTVHYQDLTGKQLADDQVLKGDVGTAYVSVSSPNISSDEYVLVSAPFNATGTYAKDNQTVLYLYKTVSTGGGGTTVDPEQPVDPTDPGTPVTPVDPTDPETPVVPVTPPTPDVTTNGEGDQGQPTLKPTPQPVADKVTTGHGGDAAKVHAVTAKQAVTQASVRRAGQAATGTVQPQALAAVPTKSDTATATKAATPATTQLPQTDEQAASGWQALGLALLGGLTGLLTWSRRRHN